MCVKEEKEHLHPTSHNSIKEYRNIENIIKIKWITGGTNVNTGSATSRENILRH